MKNINTKEKYFWALLRLGMGWIFLWPFWDKTFGMGLSTAADKAWIMGGSPTAGFLKLGTHGPFAEFFQSLVGNTFVEWLFMAGLLLIGLTLLLGILVKLAAYSGSLMLFLMWLACLPPKQNPFLDEHIIYIIILIGLSVFGAGDYFGVGKWWSNMKLVKKYPILK